MTPNTVSPAQTLPTAPAPRRPGLFGGFGGSMLGGLMMGGLIGMLLGNGLGGGMGFLGMLLQIALVFGAVSMAMRFFGRRGQTAQVGVSSPQNAPRASGMPSFTIPRIGETAGTAAPRPADEIGVQKNDLDHFQTMLADVQAAYGAEDFPALRRLTTPEAMSYLAEELGDNATQGVKNDVRDVRLLQGDVAEAWREDGKDYATVAMRYESIDVMRDRTSGAVVRGNPDKPTEAVELWTFLRERGGDWRVSAIQGVSGH
jgi:predicted lipid-binding transport protein (Tim44 family)